MKLERKKLLKEEKVSQQTEAGDDYENKIATARGAGYKEGHKAGKIEGKLIALVELVKKNIISKKIAAEQMGITAEEFERIMQERQ